MIEVWGPSLPKELMNLGYGARVLADKYARHYQFCTRAGREAFEALIDSMNSRDDMWFSHLKLIVVLTC